jgi:hypothetical protein
MIYDSEANLISWEVARGKISHARRFGNLIVHLSSSGKPLLIEMLDASKFIGQFDKLNNIKNIKELTKTMPAN